MARDIRHTLRKVLDNDGTRMIVATAAGELIRRAPTPRRKPEARIPVLPHGEAPVPTPVVTGIGGFAAGAGAATLVPMAVRGIGKLARNGRGRALFSDVPKKAAAGTRKAVTPSLQAVDAFASRLGSRGNGERTTAAKRPAAATRTGTTAKRDTSAKRSTPAKRTTGASAKRTSTANGTGARAPAKRSANGSSARATSKSRGARKPART